MMGPNICFKGVIRKIIPFNPSYLEHCKFTSEELGNGRYDLSFSNFYGKHIVQD